MSSIERRPVPVALAFSLFLNALGAGCAVSPADSPTEVRSPLVGSWTPPSLTGLKGWWDASAIVFPGDGARIPPALEARE